MKTYIGTKRLFAKPMNRLEYVTYRGWDLLADENGADEGYLVEYINDGGQHNHDEHLGYISWSPKAVFEVAYQPIDAMSFGHAIVAMQAGKKVARAGWDGKGMFIFLTKGREVPNSKDRSFAHFEEDTVVLADHIDMRAADGKYISGWLASQTDMLSDDWGVVL